MRPTLAFTGPEVDAMVVEAYGVQGYSGIDRLTAIINREVERKRSAISAYDAQVNSVGCDGAPYLTRRGVR